MGGGGEGSGGEGGGAGEGGGGGGDGGDGVSGKSRRRGRGIAWWSHSRHDGREEQEKAPGHTQERFGVAEAVSHRWTVRAWRRDEQEGLGLRGTRTTC